MGALRVIHFLGKPASLRADCIACCKAKATLTGKQIEGSPVAKNEKYITLKENYLKLTFTNL